MDLATYRRRATPRLQAIDAIAPCCRWGEDLSLLPLERQFSAIRHRETFNRLVAEQQADEQAAGL